MANGDIGERQVASRNVFHEINRIPALPVPVGPYWQERAKSSSGSGLRAAMQLPTSTH